jgi:hypothetical protein
MTDSELNKYYIGDVLKLNLPNMKYKAIVIKKIIGDHESYLKSLTLDNNVLKILHWNNSITGKYE